MVLDYMRFVLLALVHVSLMRAIAPLAWRMKKCWRN